MWNLFPQSLIEACNPANNANFYTHQFNGSSKPNNINDEWLKNLTELWQKWMSMNSQSSASTNCYSQHYSQEQKPDSPCNTFNSEKQTCNNAPHERCEQRDEQQNQEARASCSYENKDRLSSLHQFGENMLLAHQNALEIQKILAAFADFGLKCMHQSRSFNSAHSHCPTHDSFINMANFFEFMSCNLPCIIHTLMSSLAKINKNNANIKVMPHSH